ncbi:hypothetical protein PV328_008960 [Microctonus aethiopoides]|uniref:Uncharacterized protein n=1 Tax=Microctonus aethiopoides TaxID=144406 RepID=A0AA39FKC9_9HYME|nr:hypothetical protein PV328_008960 [Microctonus aethiopoides]
MIGYFLLFELICFVGSFNGEIFVSDKIDLDSNENSELIKGNGDSVAVFNNPLVKNIKQLSDYQNDESTFRERMFAKPKRSQGNFESRYNPSPLTIINNIRIFVNGNESLITSDDNNRCENGLCDVIISTIKDKNKNIVTTLQLSIITKINDIKIDDIPIIDGVRGVSISNDEINHVNYPNIIHNSPPQINRYGPNFFQPSFGVPKNNLFRHGDEFRGREQNRWLTGSDAVDDKIEAPLSRTTSE